MHGLISITNRQLPICSHYIAKEPWSNVCEHAVEMYYEVDVQQTCR